MKCLFLLSGDFIDLGKEEVLSLFDVKEFKLINKLFIIDLKNNEKELNKLSKRLALTKSIYGLLFECDVYELIKTMKSFDWDSIYKDNFCLRINYFEDMINNGKNSITKKPIKNEISKKTNKTKIFSEKDLAGHIWRSLSHPKVNLESPKTLVQLFITKNKAYCGLLIYENKGDFESRKAHLRPFPNPSSLHPKLARALVNISGIKKNETLLDPFCGTGGFLIEAGLMKIKVIGYDINKIMTNGCIKNLSYFNIKDYKIKNKNALDINDNFDHVVTDLPYGLNSNVMLKYGKDWKKYRLNKKIQKKDFKKNLEQFYLVFLKNLRKKLKKKAVIVFPNYVNYKKIIKQSKFKIEKEFSMYVHRSLTRKIVMLKNQ